METPCALCDKPMLDQENVLIWVLFNKHLATQARIGGMGGFFGVDYSSLPVLFEAFEIPYEEWWICLDKIAILTQIAMKYWNKKPNE